METLKQEYRMELGYLMEKIFSNYLFIKNPQFISRFNYPSAFDYILTSGGNDAKSKWQPFKGSEHKIKGLIKLLEKTGYYKYHLDGY